MTWNRTRTAPRTAAILAILLAVPAIASAQAVPPPPDPEPAPLSAAEAEAVASAVLGCRVAATTGDARHREFTCEGFADTRKCPLEGLADTRCGEFAWTPTAAVVFTAARTAAVTGHLARNRVVVVSLRSDLAAVSRNTLHGVLVFPTTRIAASPRPAFAWYLGRDATPADLDLADVDRDGVLDLVYAYEQPLGYTGPDDPLSVIARDFWTVLNLVPAKPVSGGETLAAPGRTIFDGVPVHEDGDEWVRRGSWRWEELSRDLPLAALIQRARLPGARTGWDLHVVADLGEGWVEVLTGGAGAGTAERSPDEPDVNCVPAESPGTVPLDVRRRILDLEAACRDAVAATRSGPPRDSLDAFPRVRAALRAQARGLPVVALALLEQAAADLLSAGPGTWPLAAALSLGAALGGHDAFARTWSAALGPAPAGLLDDAALFPALAPVLAPVDALLSRVRAVL